MTNEEALKDIRFCKCEVNKDYFVAYLKHDTIPIIKKALEKQIPIEPIGQYKVCPKCGVIEFGLNKPNYCGWCGQKLKWE